MSVYDLSATRNDGTEQPLTAYSGKVALIVNTASQCGFTPQYKGLETLYEKYKDQGLVVLGFPCNQFGGQEPGADADIRSFCDLNYGVTFPLFRKIEVNGKNTHPLYQLLKQEKSGLLGRAIRWNFTKFLIGKDGRVVARFAPSTPPEKLAKDIERELSR